MMEMHCNMTTTTTRRRSFFRLFSCLSLLAKLPTLVVALSAKSRSSARSTGNGAVPPSVPTSSETTTGRAFSAWSSSRLVSGALSGSGVPIEMEGPDFPEDQPREHRAETRTKQDATVSLTGSSGSIGT
ncbi:unnamed protein product, partial [Amoebophrya sp. A25]|eukprot:GSA25T00003983001.1